MEQHQKLAYSIARSYLNRGLPLEDLQQESLLGLFKAHENFDPGRETKFSTYAVFWIKKQILEALEQEAGIHYHTGELSEVQSEKLVSPEQPEDNASDLHLPDAMPELEKQILKLTFTHNCSLKEIADRLKLSVEKVKQHKLKALRRLRSLSK